MSVFTKGPKHIPWLRRPSWCVIDSCGSKEFQACQMELNLTQPLSQACDGLIREKLEMEARFKESWFNIKMAGKFLVQEGNKEALERDPEFMKTQKLALEAALKKLIDDERKLNQWSQALMEIKVDADVHKQLREAAGVDAELPDLGKLLQAKLASAERSSVTPFKQDAKYRELTKILGTAEDDGEDEELEVVHTQDEGKALKCPITTVLLKDPVIAPCQHTFSRGPVEELLRKNQNRMKCPVPGCNGVITLHQLKKDDEKAMLLNRWTRTQQRMTQQGEDEYDEEIDD